MKVRSIAIIIIILMWPASYGYRDCLAQDLNTKILITIGNNRTEAGEVIRMFKKSIEPGKKPDFNSYLQQYIIFKLKVADAINLGYDTTQSFRNELTGYRNQLAQNYLTDTQVKETLLKKAYQRTLTEINAWHILIALAPEPSPEDTLKAWKKATDVRERILKGEAFESVARSTSDDQSVKINGGNLGYFTAFQMIMPFEDAAYSLKKGSISEPVRTPYGYHIIKVTDKRPSKGKIKVAHIMKAAPPGTGDNEVKQAENEINSIYKKLQEGTPFSELARKQSDHKESAAKGGELDWFGTGEVISDFSEAAFSIKDTGSYTKPVRTVYGWHIIKLLDRKSPGSFEESRSYLESKINQSYLNSLSQKSFVEKLKTSYHFRIDTLTYNWFVRNTDTLIIQGLKKYDPTDMPETNIYTFADQSSTANDFADFIEKRGHMVVTKDSAMFISSSIESLASDQLINYENSNLERKYPEFRYLMNEFHDGILLFEISGKKVWNRVSEDSLGIKQYYEDHKMEHLTRQGIETKIYTLKKADGENLLSDAYNKFSVKKNTDELLLKRFNKKNDTLLVISVNKWFKGDDPEIDNLQWIIGTQSFKKGGFPSVAVIMNVIEPVPLSFKEVQGEMMTGYQEYLEKEWIGQLKEKYNVKINNIVLDELRRKLTNE